MAKLDAKGIYRCIRNGYGFDEFEAKYGLSEDVLRNEISERIFRKGSQANVVLKQIVANTKKNRKQANTKQARVERIEAPARTQVETPVQIRAEVTPQPQAEPPMTRRGATKIALKDQQMVATYAGGCVILTPPAPGSDQDQSTSEHPQDSPQNIPELLQDLRAKANVHEAEIMELDTEYDKKAAKRDEKSRELKSLDAEIEKIKGILQKKSSERMRIQIEMDNSAKSMRATAKRRQKVVGELEEVSRQIAGLEIAMMTYIDPSDYSISFDDPDTPVEVEYIKISI